MSEMKITVVCENTAGIPMGVRGEWGLALWVEKAGEKILLDTGQTASLLNNAAAMGIDLRQAHSVVLSHGHYDHTGGLKALLEYKGPTTIYAHPDVFMAHSAQRGSPVYIGIPFTREELTGLGANFVFTDKAKEIVPGVWVSGSVPRQAQFGEPSGHFCYPRDGGYLDDNIPDDMSLYVVTSQGLMIILGCAHAGLVNIVQHARQVTGVDKIFGIIGGTHLGPVPVDQQKQIIEFLQTLDLQLLAANHCTGLPLMARLSHIFPHSFSFAPAGTSFALP